MPPTGQPLHMHCLNRLVLSLPLPLYALSQHKEKGKKQTQDNSFFWKSLPVSLVCRDHRRVCERWVSPQTEQCSSLSQWLIALSAMCRSWWRRWRQDHIVRRQVLSVTPEDEGHLSDRMASKMTLSIVHLFIKKRPKTTSWHCCGCKYWSSMLTRWWSKSRVLKGKGRQKDWGCKRWFSMRVNSSKYCLKQRHFSFNQGSCVWNFWFNKKPYIKMFSRSCTLESL